MSNILDRLKKLNKPKADAFKENFEKNIEILSQRQDKMPDFRKLAMGLQEQIDEKVSLSNLVDDEVPTGSINGSNKTFTLAYTPNPTTSLKVFVNGQKQTLTTGYSLSGKTLTTIVAYPTGTTLTVDYRY